MRLSFEFFPPRTPEGIEGIGRVAGRLDEFGPEFFSCTYGAGGSTRDGTFDTVAHLRAHQLEAAPHLSIGADSAAATTTLLDRYRALGVRRIVALRGDAPSGMGRNRFAANAEALVKRIRAHSGDHFHVEVAAYPEVHPDGPSPEVDLDFFERKVAAGADSAITQYFYNAPAYFDFVERARARGITVPIVPGIMPITNFEGIVRFSTNCGADVPRWIYKRIEALASDEVALRAFGVTVVTGLCRELLAGGAPGLHFYTLNRWGATSRILSELGNGGPDR
jgi:methylenetetrahydrofolate reductase (NADPH)